MIRLSTTGIISEGVWLVNCRSSAFIAKHPILCVYSAPAEHCSVLLCVYGLEGLNLVTG